jgi:hypothetical protein
LEDDADLAPMVHQDQLQKLTKDVSSTDPNKQLKQDLDEYMGSLEEKNLLISTFF